MINKRNFSEVIDSELKDITFKENNKKKVLDKISKPQGKVKRILEREILFPVVPVITAVFLITAGIVYTYTSSLRVNQEDIQKSRIIVIEQLNGGIDR